MSALLYENAKILLTAICIIAFSWLIEYCWPAHKDPGLKFRINNLVLFAFLLLGLLILPFVARVCAIFLPDTALIDRIFPGWEHNGVRETIMAIFIYALVWDVFQYWTHRAQHVFPKLWLFHRVHHSDRAMNASTSLRQSLGSVLLGYLFVHLPTLMVCGTHLLPYFGSIILFSGWGYLNHANVRVSFGTMTNTTVITPHFFLL